MEGIHRWPGEFPAQRASNAENVSNWWCLHDINTQAYVVQRHQFVKQYFNRIIQLWRKSSPFINPSLPGPINRPIVAAQRNSTGVTVEQTKASVQSYNLGCKPKSWSGPTLHMHIF